MAKQTINVGSAELAGDGESLRSAFDKINDNFDELYISSGGGIALTDLSVSTNPAGTAALPFQLFLMSNLKESNSKRAIA